MENDEKKYLISKEIDEWAENNINSQYERLKNLDTKRKFIYSNSTESLYANLITAIKDCYNFMLKKQLNYKEFCDDVDKINNTQNYPFHKDKILFGFTPKILSAIGYQELPLYMSSEHLYTCIKENGFIQGDNIHYHNLSANLIKTLPFLLPNTFLIAKSNTYPDNLISFIDYPIKDINGKDVPLLTIYNPSGSMSFERIKLQSNKLTSIYGKDDVQKWLNNFDLSQILYLNKKISQQYQLTTPLDNSVAGLVQPSGFYINNINQYIQKVNLIQNNRKLVPNTKKILLANKAIASDADCDINTILHEPMIPNFTQITPTISEEVENFEQKPVGILNIVGKRFDVDEKGTPTFEGLKSLSKAMQIYSDKHYETARYLFIKNGQIVRHVTVSSQTPSSTTIKPDEIFLYSLRNYAEETESKIVFLHNHPSGYVEPSEADIKLTNYLANFFTINGESIFSGHIILDHGTYGLYTEKTREWGALINGELKPLSELRANIGINFPADTKIASFNPDFSISTQSLIELSEYAKECDDVGTWNTKDWVPCLLLSSNGIVTNFDVIKNHEFENINILSNKLKQLGREFGSENIILFPRTSKQFLITERFAQLTRKIKDIYFEKDDGTFELSQFPNGNIFNDLTRGDIKIVDSENYVEEVKVKIAAENKKDIENRNQRYLDAVTSLENFEKYIHSEALKDALKEVAIPLEKIEFTRDNYNKLFPYSKIETPIESVKMGEHQFEKLEVKQREFILQATHDTLSNPDLIINEKRKNIFGEQEDTHLYAKSFLIDDKVHGIQSVVVSIDGENVSISTHERDINNFVNKIKKPDQLLYAAAKVRLLVERATGKQLVTVNPTREFEYVKSLDSNLQQNSETVKQELKPELKTYHKLKKEEIDGLKEITQEEFNSIIDALYQQPNPNYKEIPPVIKLPQINEEIAQKLGVENANFFMRSEIAHVRPQRKGSYDQALRIEEMKGMLDFIKTCQTAYIDNDEKHQNFMLAGVDEQDSKKSNKIVFNKDEYGNYIVTVGKVDTFNLEESRYSKVAVGVEPTIWMELKAPSIATMLRSSTTSLNENIQQETESVKQESKENEIMENKMNQESELNIGENGNEILYDGLESETGSRRSIKAIDVWNEIHETIAENPEYEAIKFETLDYLYNKGTDDAAGYDNSFERNINRLEEISKSDKQLESILKKYKDCKIDFDDKALTVKIAGTRNNNFNKAKQDLLDFVENKKYLRESEINQNQGFSLFDKELYLFNNGQLDENHVFNLGKPGEILKNCGFPENDRIELVASRLKIKASQGNHPFEIMDILGLDKALQNPIAVFEYGEKEKAQNVIVNLEKDGKNFLVGVFFNQKKGGFEVSSIRGLFNRDNLDWMRWIQQGKMIYGDKERIQVLANQQRTNLADVNSKEARTLSDLYYLDSLDNILQNFAGVKNIYTRDFPRYTEQKEKFEIFKQFRSAYQETDSINIYDAVKDADEFYKAIKNNDKSIIEKFTNGIEKAELASVASLILENGGSHVQLKGIDTQALNPNLHQNSEIIDNGIEQIQADYGLSENAIENSYDAEQNQNPDYLDENGIPHWYSDEENEINDGISDEELIQIYKQKYPDSSLSISEDTKKELENVFSKIDDYLDKGTVPEESRFTLPKTPSYLQELGSDETVISLPVSVIKKAKETHGLSNEEIKKSLLRFYDPVVVFDTDKEKSENKQDSKLILTDEFAENKPIALAVNTNANIRISNGKQSLEVQDIRSIHDRTLIAKNETDLIKQWTENGLCRYIDDKKISDWSNVSRVYFPIDELQSDKNNILIKSEIVNSQEKPVKQEPKENKIMKNENSKSSEQENKLTKEQAAKAVSLVSKQGFSQNNQEEIAIMFNKLKTVNSIAEKNNEPVSTLDFENPILISEAQIFAFDKNITEENKSKINELPYAVITVPDKDIEEGEEQTFHQEKYYLLDSLPNKNVILNQNQEISPRFLEYKDFNFIPIRKFSDEEKTFVDSILSDKQNEKNLSKNSIFFAGYLEKQKPENEQHFEKALKVFDKDSFSKQAESDADIFYCKEKGTFYTSNGNYLVPLEFKIKSKNAEQDIFENRFSQEIKDFKIKNSEFLQNISPLVFNETEDKELMENISDVLSEGDTFTRKNQNLSSDVKIRLGELFNKKDSEKLNPTGLRYLIKHRIEERLNKGVSLEDAQKQVSCLLFLAINNIDKAPAVKEPNGHYAIYKNGIKTVVGTDKKGHYVVTGFDYNNTSQEAEVAIGTGIARYGYTPEFLDIYAQVGASLASLGINISQSKEKSNIVSKDEPQREMDSISQTEAELRKELVAAEKKIEALKKKLEETLEQNNNLQRENSAIKDATQVKDNTPANENQAISKTNQIQDSQGRRTNNDIDTKNFSKENAFLTNTLIPKFGLKGDDGKIRIIEGAVFKKQLLEEKDPSANKILLEIQKEDGTSEEIKISEFKYQEIINGIERLNKFKEEMGNKQTLGDWFKAHADYNQALLLDEFKLRENTAGNFIHNFKARCLLDARNRDEAIKIAARMVKDMDHKERKLFNKDRKEKGAEEFDNILIDIFDEIHAQKELAIKDVDIFYDVSLSNNSLERGLAEENRDLNEMKTGDLIPGCEKFKVGDTVPISITTKGFDGKQRKTPKADFKIARVSKNVNPPRALIFNEKTKAMYLISLTDLKNHLKKVERIQLKDRNKIAEKDYKQVGYDGPCY